MVKEKLNPAEYIVSVFKGYDILSKQLAVAPATIRRWAYINKGAIPTKYHYDIVKIATFLSLPINGEHTKNGGEGVRYVNRRK